MSCAACNALDRAAATRIAPARVCFTLCAYFGLARKVSSDGPRLLHAGHPGDFDRPIAAQFAAQRGREIGKIHYFEVSRRCTRMHAD